MTERKTLSIVALGAIASLLAVASFGAKAQSLAVANEESETRSLLLTAEAIGEALEDDKDYVKVDGLKFSFSNATYAEGKLTFAGGELYNENLAGESKNAQNRIGTGFKKVVFEGLENSAGFTVSFMSDKTTKLETITMEAGGAATEATLSLIGNAKKVSMAFNPGTGVSFASITYFYTCGNAS